MADQEPKNPPPAGGLQSEARPTGQKAEPSSARPEPKIRTMKSDIAEFMKETKPSLIQILTKQVEYQPAAAEEARPLLPIKTILITAAAIVVVGGLGLAAYFYLIPGEPGVAPMPAAEEAIPNSPIFVEKTQAATSFANAFQLQQVIFGAAQNIERPQSLKRLVIKIKESGGERLLTARDFFNILNINPPSQLPDSLQETLFLYVYYGTGGPRFVFIAPSRNAGRTFAGMLGWENSMQRDLEIMFLGETVSQVIAPFLDKTFKNIDYRILSVKPGMELGHFMFSAKNLLVIATSEEALQVVINRLLEAR